MVNEEMKSLNLEDMDVEELEDRLELALGEAHLPMISGGGPAEASCTNYCPGLCNFDVCYSDS